jgi:competence protein ComGC
LKTQEFPTKKVAWLLAVPISDKEKDFLTENGSDALESLFEEKQIDIFELDRKSIV